MIKNADDQKRIKEVKANWYIKNRERLLERQKENYKKKKRVKCMKIINEKIIIRFD